MDDKGVMMPLEPPAMPSHGGPPGDLESAPWEPTSGTMKCDDAKTCRGIPPSLSDSARHDHIQKTIVHGRSRRLALGSLLLATLFLLRSFILQPSNLQSWRSLLQSVPEPRELHFTPILPPSYPLAVRSPYLSGKDLRSWLLHMR